MSMTICIKVRCIKINIISLCDVCAICCALGLAPVMLFISHISIPKFPRSALTKRAPIMLTFCSVLLYSNISESDSITFINVKTFNSIKTLL